MIFPEGKTAIMGVLNVTPDSFSDGGQFFDIDDALVQARQFIAEGVDSIDIGGESSRPGARPVSEEEELRRVIPLIERLRTESDIPISIDTYKPRVAEAALQAGATLVNDITGLTNPELRAVVAHFQAPAIIMHMQGTPQTMQEHPQYDDVIQDIKAFFRKQIALAQQDGIHELILDPGIGFGKTLQHNLHILKQLEEFCDLGYPVLIGPSRKSFIGTITGLPVEERLEGTIAAVVIGAMNGAQIVRVHDVQACRRALMIADAILHKTF